MRLLSVVLLASLPLVAEAQGVLVAVTNSCGTYLQHRQQGIASGSDVYAIQIRGYLSGFNMATSGTPTRSMPEAETVLAYMDKYCRDHPLDDTFLGMGALVRDLGGKR
jgi:hypothetical protein